MNSGIIRYVLGFVLKIEGIILLLPCAVAFIYGESEGISYAGVAAVSLLIGILMSYRKPKSNVF